MAQYLPFPLVVKGFAMRYLKKKYDKGETKFRWNRTIEIYKGFVEEVPDIGGKKNPMSVNLYMGLAVFALYEAVDKKITPEELKTLINEYVPKRIPVVSSIFDFNKSGTKKLMQGKYDKYKPLFDEKFNNGEWGNNWRIELNPHNRNKGVAFDLVGCPIADFAKEHGYLHLMPSVCSLDYLTASLMHAKLLREHTVAEGFESCDYWYIGDKESEF